ncbi:MAG: PAS domain-containing protein [Acidobacteria bacterium]|nr:PAS domain-containing protein [Acidobacteriota bacterium]
MIEKQRFLTDKTNLLAFASGLFACLAGSLVIIGWHTKALFLIQILPTFVPMQYNTALGFLLCGAGLIFVVWQRPVVPLITGALVFLLGAATFLQYLLNADFGIDQFFVKAYVTTLTFHPGRMSPITAIAFLLCGAALLFMGLPLIGKLRLSLISLLGGMIGGIGIVLIYGYLAGVTNLFGLTQFTKMALHTAICFTALSLGILSISWRASVSRSTPLPVWLPLTALSAGLIITLGLWLAIRANEQKQLERIVSAEAHKVSELIDAQIKTRMLALARMANRWQSRGGTPQKEWELDAQAYIQDYSDFQAIEWVDTTYHVRWVVPLMGNESALNLDLASIATRQQDLLAARKQGVAVITHTLELRQGGKGFLVYVPIFHESQFLGFILGIFRTDKLLKDIFHKSDESLFGIAVLEAGTEIYRQGSAPALPAISEAAVSVGEMGWQIQMWPTTKFYQANSTFFSEAMLLIGVLVSGGLALALRGGELRRLRARLTETLNQGLLQQIEERQKAEQKLRESEQRFATFMSNSPMVAFIKDEAGHYVYMNEVMERLFQINPLNLTDKTAGDWLPTEIAAIAQTQDATILSTQQTMAFIDIAPTADGVLHYWLTYKFPMRDALGQNLVGGVALDITERVKAEAALKASLQEKETLLKEIHHRVKNNLQVIASLLSLQSSFVRDPHIFALCQESQHRVKTMALIHEKLYQSENLSHINFGEYINNLATYLLRSYSSSARETQFEIQAEAVLLTIDTAIPCGLIVNELFSNALKHGQAEGGDSRVGITIVRVGETGVRLCVADNGQGFPAHLDFRKTESLGLQLVGDLVRQIKGTLELENHSGTSFIVSFNL